MLGRPFKTEVLNWEGGSVYTTTVNSYNARDQITLVRQHAGAEGSGAYQDTTMTYDGYGRLKTKHVPEQQVDPNNSSSTDHTTWDYYSDDTVQKITDARGSVSNFTYNNRHRTIGIGLITSRSNANDDVSTVAYTNQLTYGHDQMGRLKEAFSGTLFFFGGLDI